MIPRLLKAGKARILAGAFLLTAITIGLDWLTGHTVSLAALYILPMMLAAVVLRPIETAALAAFCSYLRSFFDVTGSPLDLTLKFLFAAAAYFLSGLFVTALVRNHEQAVKHLDRIQTEQTLRREAEEQLRLLAESSPAAILTVDGAGMVLGANGAAHALFMIPDGETLVGSAIGRYLPFLADALRLDAGSMGLRTAAQAQGHRGNGEVFLAHTWFSSYSTPKGVRLAAIVVDSSEDMRDREEQGMRQLRRGNRIATAIIAHEVRNFCEAMTMLCADLKQRPSLAQDEALRGLDNLVAGLEGIASLELGSTAQEVIEHVSLREVLDDLRIVIEPEWREIEGAVRWNVPDGIPRVLAERHGLLQAFLNLSQNGHRAVQPATERELQIAVCSHERKVAVIFEDSGPGVSAPERLFQPFQKGASGTGLGLYTSRFIVRSYGGDLRFEPSPRGARFVVELDAV